MIIKRNWIGFCNNTEIRVLEDLLQFFGSCKMQLFSQATEVTDVLWVKHTFGLPAEMPAEQTSVDVL